MQLLGFQVRDKVSGLVGIAEQYVELLTGQVQYSVQPHGDGKELPRAYSIDPHVLAPTGEIPVVIPVAADQTVIVRLGDEVEDLASGFSGIATQKITFLNGCVFFTVMSRTIENTKEGGGYTLFLDHKRLRVTRPQRFQEKVAKHLEPREAAPTGGPRTLSHRI
jgi:hypothetical protein